MIESQQGGVERRTLKVLRWREAEIMQRWVASVWLLTEWHFRRSTAYGNLWALAAVLGRQVESRESLPSPAALPAGGFLLRC
jgi:hypothetical protein